MTRRIRCCLVVLAAVALAGCVDRIPESPNALSPSAQRTTDTPMTGGETMDHRLDDKRYVQADPF